MLGRLFSIFAPMCVISFICFGITYAIFGKTGDSGETLYVGSFEDIREDYTAASSQKWSVENDFTDISIDTGGMSVVVTSSPDVDRAQFSFTQRGDASVRTYLEGSVLVVECTGSSNSVFFDVVDDILDDIGDGKINIPSLFKGTTLEITLPDECYESVSVSAGTGNAQIVDVSSNAYNIECGTGWFAIKGDIDCDTLTADLASGKLEIEGIRPKHYDINLGSGTAKLHGLTGHGSFDMGSGYAELQYAAIDGRTNINVTSGSLSIGVPADADLDIHLINSVAGSVKVDACGTTKNKMSNDETLTFGKHGVNSLELDIVSGSINIFDADHALFRSDT